MSNPLIIAIVCGGGKSVMKFGERYTLQDLACCRFCGKCGGVWLMMDDGFYVQCQFCHAEGPHIATDYEAAILAWFEDDKSHNTTIS